MVTFTRRTHHKPQMQLPPQVFRARIGALLIAHPRLVPARSIPPNVSLCHHSDSLSFA